MRIPAAPAALLAILASLAPWAPAPALAQDPPRCEDARLGAVACIAGRLCECRFERGGQITGLPDMFRWDCSTLRPPCGEGILPATPFPTPGQVQPGIILTPPRR
jgi:hypothetical protein